MSRALIIGATSAIAEATARILAQRGWHLYLTGRDPQRLEAIALDLKLRGAASVNFQTLEANDFAAHDLMLARADAALHYFDTALIAHGTLSDQIACESSFELALQEITTNALSVVSLSSRIATRLAARHSGTIVVISSVAGDRGRQSNYVYGCAKSLVTTFLSGLRQRMHKYGVNVITVKPGFVDTPMTAAFAKGLLWSKPESVAAGIVSAIARKRDVVYLPFFWRPIMLMVRLVPERVFKRLTL
jgi:decaprenylphospho-beta-D-erythro-pentofuranosid-2-ulose 2-reductase